MAMQGYEKYDMLATQKKVTDYNSKGDEFMLGFQKFHRQMERESGGEPLEEELECEAELRRARQHLQCLQSEEEISRLNYPEAWKIRDRISSLADENYKKKMDISELRREHQLVRCCGTSCHDHEDSMLWFSDALRKNLYRTKSRIISRAAMDRLMKQTEEKIIRVWLLSELAYLYKQFRAHPGNLAPAQMEKSSLDKMILSEYEKVKSRVKVLTSQHRKTAKDPRLAEEEFRPTGRTARKDPPPARKVSARKGSSRKTPVSQPARRKKDPKPLIAPQILAIVEEDFAQLTLSAKKETARDVEERAKKPTSTRGVAQCEPPKRGYARSESKAPVQVAARPQFRRPVKQVKQSECPDSYGKVHHVGACSEVLPGYWAITSKKSS